MDVFERVLDERAAELTRMLEVEAGFSSLEAERFLWAAAGALIAAYEWNRSSRRPIDLRDEEAAGELLAVIHGRALAAQLRLTPAKTWAGLRVMVPAVVDASAPGTPDGAATPDRARRVRIFAEEAARLVVGLEAPKRPDRQRRGGSTIAE